MLKLYILYLQHFLLASQYFITLWLAFWPKSSKRSWMLFLSSLTNARPSRIASALNKVEVCLLSINTKYQIQQQLKTTFIFKFLPFVCSLPIFVDLYLLPNRTYVPFSDFSEGQWYHRQCIFLSVILNSI